MEAYELINYLHNNPVSYIEVKYFEPEGINEKKTKIFFFYLKDALQFVVSSPIFVLDYA
jgi:hypothetical protein